MYKTYNKQFEKTAVDISQLNITALLHELRSGQRYRAPKEAKAKTQAARGPTTIDVRFADWFGFFADVAC